MTDIKSPRLLYTKGALFVLGGVMASGLILAECPTVKVALLLGIAVWCFARAYYFAFYVIEHYIDPSYKFAGITLVHLVSAPETSWRQGQVSGIAAQTVRILTTHRPPRHGKFHARDSGKKPPQAAKRFAPNIFPAVGFFTVECRRRPAAEILPTVGTSDDDRCSDSNTSLRRGADVCAWSGTAPVGQPVNLTSSRSRAREPALLAKSPFATSP